MRTIKLHLDGLPESNLSFFQEWGLSLEWEGKQHYRYRAESEAALARFLDKLADHIWSREMEEWVLSYLGKKGSFSSDECFAIGERTMDIALGLKEGSDVIREKLEESFLEDDFLHVPGFVTFRLNGLRQDLEALADLCCEEWLAEREYDAFLQLLRSFVEVQPSDVEEVHFVTDEEGRHHIYGQDGEDLSFHCLEDFAEESMVEEAEYDDLMVSSLLSLAPKRVYLHNAQASSNPQLVETVKSIFAGRVIVR